MEQVEKWSAEELGAIEVFRGMGEAGWKALSAKTQVFACDVAETVVAVDDDPDYIYFLLKGTVQVQVPGTGIIPLAAGTFFGEGSLVESDYFLPPGWRLRKRTASVVATEPSRVARLHVDELGLILRSWPDVQKAIIEEAKRRIGD